MVLLEAVPRARATHCKSLNSLVSLHIHSAHICGSVAVPGDVTDKVSANLDLSYLGRQTLNPELHSLSHFPSPSLRSGVLSGQLASWSDLCPCRVALPQSVLVLAVSTEHR